MTDKDQKRIFKDNLNRILIEHGKTQREVSSSIGVSPQTFNTWCQGIALPRMGKLQLLADYFMINKSDLIEDHSCDIVSMATDKTPLLSDEAIQIGLAYDSAQEWEKDAVAKLLDVKRDSNAEVLDA